MITSMVLLAGPALVRADDFSLENGFIDKRTQAVLAMMGYSVVPDLTTSTLSITNTQTGDPHIIMSQLAGGFTISKTTPLYLEGGIAYSRYDPTFVATNGVEERNVPTKWTSVMLTGGVGWDFPIAKELVLRPIANFAVGHLETDLSAFGRLVQRKSGTEIDFLDGGRLNAVGYGGSLMLDYEHYRPDHEIDVEWRYSAVRLQTFDTVEAAAGHSDAISTSLWARWRAPTGFTMLDRPLRYVLEVAHSTFFGAQKDLLGFNYLSSIGAGLEVDSSAYNIIVTRTRLVLRYRFGENVSGASVGFAVSF